MTGTHRTPKIGDCFRISGGDGDQAFFAGLGVLRLTEADWFPGTMPAWGKALLFIVEEGEFSGEYVALTSKSTMDVGDQISDRGSAGVVVHRITNATDSFGQDANGSRAIGMAFVGRI